MPSNRVLFRSVVLIAIVFAVALIGSQAVVAPPIYPHQIYILPPKVIPYDNATPTVSILHPSEVALESHNIVLNFTVTKPVSWNNGNITFANYTEYYGLVFKATYTLDGREEVSMAASDNWTSDAVMSFALNLTDLMNGPHHIVVNASAWCLFAPDLFGLRFPNYVEGTSGMFNFTINVPPEVLIISPQNVVYNESSVQFTFTTNEPISRSWFSVDNQENQTISGNVTLADLAEGQHSLRVYAQIPWGSVGVSELVNFSVDLPPIVRLLSPARESYNGTVIPVSFADNKPILWAAYSLDGENYVPIAGNTSLTGVSDGFHSLVVYAADIYGNVGQSACVTFVRVPAMAPAPSPYTVYDEMVNNATLVIVTLLAIVTCTVFCVVLFKRRRKGDFSKAEESHVRS